MKLNGLKNVVLIMGVILLLVFVSGLPAAGGSPPLAPAAYWGSVRYSTGSCVDSGTVEAYIDGELAGNAEIKDGFYGGPGGFDPKLYVEGNEDTVGKAVYFRVNGFAAAPAVVWNPGDTLRVDLDAGLRCGDVNRSDTITAADAALVLCWAAGTASLEEDQQRAADVDGNGAVDGEDARLILKRVVRLVSSFPVEDNR